MSVFFGSIFEKSNLGNKGEFFFWTGNFFYFWKNNFTSYYWEPTWLIGRKILAVGTSQKLDPGVKYKLLLPNRKYKLSVLGWNLTHWTKNMSCPHQAEIWSTEILSSSAEGALEIFWVFLALILDHFYYLGVILKYNYLPTYKCLTKI